ncbi:MAG: T9SS type A sorting domain-containing protein [Candidatus Zixiibacteriota bacterium]
MKRATIAIVFAAVLLCFLVSLSRAQTPNMENRTHRIGNIGFTVTNYGILGSWMRDLVDPWTGLPAPSAEFPLDSGLEYLFSGYLWVGAIVDGDTLVSTASDGWWNVREMYPNDDDSIFHDQEKCDLRFIATYYDTSTGSWVEPDPFDGPHRPIGLKFEQKSYSWEDPPNDDFIIIEYDVTNISGRTLSDLYLGLHIDGDVHYHDAGAPGAQDDIAGFLDWWHPGEDSFKVDVAWIADNDGDPTGGQFDDHSPISVTGVKVLKPPGQEQEMSFNWWISNVNAQYDWGPQRVVNQRVFLDGNRGTPTGDACRYYVMSNGDFDYDQVWTSYQFPGWIDPPPEPMAGDIANGYDTRYLLSYGPFEMAPGEDLSFTVGYICGEDFHTDPLGFDPNHPESTVYNYDDFASAALWVQHLYDSLFTPVGVPDESEHSLPTEFRLAQNHPNPFNARTVIGYQLPIKSEVRLEVYNLLGQKLATLVDGKQEAGFRSVIWEASQISSGIYFYRLTAGDFTEVRRMMLMK